MVGRFDLYLEMDRWVSILGMRVNVDFVLDGLRFGGSLLAFLTVHEFGHYFAARYHRVSTSLPYYIPFPFNGIGTFGAVIRIREQIPSLRKLFDIGAAGPIAGFVVSLGVLIYGLATLPGPEYLLDVPGHEALKAYINQFGTLPDRILSTPQDGSVILVVGQTPLYWFMTQFVEHVPPMHEMYHYPYLFAGWLGLFFTALNLLPVGQLDGGHILYALVGPKWHSRLARGFVIVLLVSGAIGFVQGAGDFRSGSLLSEVGIWAGLSAILFIYLWRMFGMDLNLIAPTLLGIVLIAAIASAVGPSMLRLGYSGWLIWCALIAFLIRVDHPPVLVAEPLTRGRRWAAYASLVIFLLCFSLKPLYIP
ncbi:MAG: site-2 protease family protein [Rhodothermales bacterium]|nr:site-2 protease family protein [Rhodothermales bacterium]